MTDHTAARLADAIRILSIDAIVKVKEGHQGVPLGMAEIATALFARHMKFFAAQPLWFDRDRFVLSNGHGSMLLYSLLYLLGYQKIDIDQIRSFRELGSHCAGHPEIDQQAGIEVTTGPLGQGIANALGMAIAEAYLNQKFGSDLVNHFTYAFVGDGCLQEGIGQEMISLAGHLRLGKLILFWDDNQITDDGGTQLSISENVSDRFRVAQWHVIEVDGHDLESVSRAIAAARADPRPSLIACRTIIAKGIVRLEGQRGGHSSRIYPEDAAQARAELDWPSSIPFEVPEDTLAEWRAAGARGCAEYTAWCKRVDALPAEDRDEFLRLIEGRRPAHLHEVLRQVKESICGDTKAKPGIQCSGELNDAIASCLPERLVACADLEAPTGHKRSLSAFTAGNRSGAYIHCGVREHVMGAMANGMAAHGGIIPLAVTYLAFSDYERPAMRMAALMGLPTIFVFSHDSIGVGRNGPTHQPVEILASLRAMPNMLVMRPADEIESAECWEIALEQRRTPSSLVFARQDLPRVRRDIDINRCRMGAYVLADAEGGPRQVTLLATGSEVQVAMNAREMLQHRRVRTAVVSMPCWELFDQQTAAYRDEVLCPGTVQIAIEAAVRLGWDRYIGIKGGFVGMDGFGASGPAEDLFRHFGITPERVVETASALLTQRV
jgi:transketolase